MQNDIIELSDYLISKLRTSEKRTLVGIAGIPASGKSTLALRIVERVNSLASTDPARPPMCILVGLDGWHLSRKQLDDFEDPKWAHDRRGAVQTFDGLGYLTVLQKLRADDPSEVVTAPSFDHSLKDPCPDAVVVHPHHRIVVVEGLYTFLSVPPWSEGGALFDERWLVLIDIAEAHRRLVRRHVVTGVTATLEEAIIRSEQNDMPNGQFVLANLLPPTRVIQSEDDPSL